jgi:hypothetical protein
VSAPFGELSNPYKDFKLKLLYYTFNNYIIGFDSFLCGRVYNMNYKEVSGAVITIIGVILLAYVFIVGGLHGHIGAGGKITADAWAALIGWFFTIGGPALWFGEVPAAIKRRVAGQTEVKRGEEQ